jgi:hypothetical protein
MILWTDSLFAKIAGRKSGRQGELFPKKSNIKFIDRSFSEGGNQK